jgi:hypothetical protein
MVETMPCGLAIATTKSNTRYYLFRPVLYHTEKKKYYNRVMMNMIFKKKLKNCICCENLSIFSDIIWSEIGSRLVARRRRRLSLLLVCQR